MNIREVIAWGRRGWIVRSSRLRPLNTVKAEKRAQGSASDSQLSELELKPGREYLMRWARSSTAQCPRRVGLQRILP